MEIKVAYYKAGLLKVLQGDYKNSYNCPRVRNTYKGIVNICNYKGEYITNLDL